MNDGDGWVHCGTNFAGTLAANFGELYFIFDAGRHLGFLERSRRNFFEIDRENRRAQKIGAESDIKIF